MPSIEAPIHIAPQPDRPIFQLTTTEQKFRTLRKEALAKEGRILPATHDFSQTLTRVATKLGLPKDYEVVGVDSDTEQAACDFMGKVIFAYRGVFQKMIHSEEFRNKPFTEDHIAAVLAHEIAHAQKMGDEYVNKISLSLKERLLSYFSHGEEYRADEKALSILENAGYNPQAFIEVLNSFGNDAGRGSITHPQVINRVRKLQIESTQDTKGILLEEKEYTPLPPTLRTWIEGENFAGETDVYQPTDQLLHKNMEELEASLLSSQTQEEFWQTYTVWQHARQITQGEQFINEHGQLLLQYVKNLMILSQLGEPIVLRKNGTIHETQGAYVDTKWDLVSTSYINRTVFEGVDDSLNPILLFHRGTYVLSDTLEAEIYRNELLSRNNEQKPSNKKERKAGQDKLTILNQDIEKSLTYLFDIRPFFRKESPFSFLRGYLKASPENRSRAAYLKQMFQNRHVRGEEILEQEFFSNGFLQLDAEYQRQMDELAIQHAQQKEMRDPQNENWKSYNLQDLQVRKSILHQTMLQIASELIPPATPTPAMMEALTRCIHNDTGIPSSLAMDLARISFSPLESDRTMEISLGRAIQNFIQRISPDKYGDTFLQLTKWIPGFTSMYDQKRTIQNPLISSQKNMHQSFLASEKILETVGVFDDTGFRAQVKKFMYGGPTDPRRYFFEQLADMLEDQPRENLSLPVIKSLLELEPKNKTSKKLYAQLFTEYTHCLDNGLPIDPALADIVRENAENLAYISLDNQALTTFMTKQQLFSPEELAIKLEETGIIEGTFFKSIMQAEQSGFAQLEDTQHILKNLTHMLSVAYEVAQKYQNNPALPLETFRPEKISALLTHATYESLVYTDPPKNKHDAYIQTIMHIIQQGIMIDPKMLTLGMMQELGNLALVPEKLQQLAAFLEHQQSPTFLNLVRTLQALDASVIEIAIESFHTTSRQKKLHPAHKEFSYKTQIAPLELTFEGTLVDSFILRQKENQEAVSSQVAWVIKNLSPSIERDFILFRITNFHQEFLHAEDLMTEVDAGGRQSASFPFIRFRLEKDQTGRFDRKFLGSPFQEANFPDILRRRYPFLHQKARYNNQERDNLASPRQQFEARQLAAAEGQLFDTGKSFSERLNYLQAVSHTPNLVRDIYLEEMLLREIEEKSPQERLTAFSATLSLFTDKGTIRTPFAVQFLRDTLDLNPEMFTNADFTQALTFLTTFLPQPSLARNYFLDRWENSSATLTPDQFMKIESLRISLENKGENDNAEIIPYLFNQFDDLSRKQKIDTLLWMLDSSNNSRSKKVIELEKELNGHLNGLPSLFASITPNEREVFLARFLLGAEGILDMGAVRPELQEHAKQQQRAFIEKLGAMLFRDSPPDSPFQELFTTMISESDPIHAAHVVTSLINMVYERTQRGGTVSPAESTAAALIEMGIVGKKTAQYLAELDWVQQYPDYYRALSQAQENGPVVPRHVLLQFAQQDGLLDTSKPFSIIEFGPSLGAASNKQANLVVVEVRQENNALGLPVGKHTLVYKARRPSAITSNINHDIDVLKKVYDALPEKQRQGKLPPSLAEEIQDAATREIDFVAEREFNHRMRTVLEHRYPSHEIGMPTIVFASAKGILETPASSRSLRSLYDQLAQKADSQLEHTIREIEQKVLVEAFREIIDGAFHADLQPGNIHVDINENGELNRIDLIDWGMREELTQQQKGPTQQLLLALALGNQELLKSSLEQLAWENAATIEFPPDMKSSDNYVENFSRYSIFLLNQARNEKNGLPRHIVSILAGLSKLQAYAKHADASQIFSSIFRAPTSIQTENN